jgi:biopolymer transport protein ExbD
MRFRKLRSTTGDAKVEIQMTPMLDMIFQLLIFFILTFKPVTDEGQFGVNMSALPGGSVALPTIVPGMGSQDDTMPQDIQFNPPYRIRLVAGPGGDLAPGGVVMGDHPLAGLDQLQTELRAIVGGFADDFEVVIEADPSLRYAYLIQAVNTISHVGITKINFGAPPPPQP